MGYGIRFILFSAWAVLWPTVLLGEPSFSKVCEDQLSLLSGLSYLEPGLTWKTDFLNDRPLSSLGAEAAAARARWISDAMFDNDSPVGKQADKFLADITNIPNWYEKYLLSYEIFYHSPEWQEVTKLADAALPKTGRVYDLGAGTGGMASLLNGLAPGRDVIATDRPGAENIIARRNQFSQRPLEHQVLTLSKIAKLPSESAKGILVNQVLYTLPDRTKGHIFKMAFDALEPGGVLVLNEPVPIKAGGRTHQQWFTDVVASGAANGAHQTEFDVALLAAIASGRLTREMRGGAPLKHDFPSPAEVMLMASEAGLRLESSQEAYGGFTHFYVFKKPK